MQKPGIFAGKQVVNPLLYLLPVLFLTTVAHNQDRPKMMLREIKHGFVGGVGGDRPPHAIELNANNGFIEFSRERPKGRIESFRFTYQFDRDMNALDFANEYPYELNLIALSQPDETHRHGFGNPHVRGATDAAGSMSHFLESQQTDPRRWKYPNKRGYWIGERSGYVKAYKEVASDVVGPVRSNFVTQNANTLPDDATGNFTWFYFTIWAPGTPYDKNGFDYDVVFVYEVLDSDDPADTDTESDTGSGGTTTLPRQTVTMKTQRAVYAPAKPIAVEYSVKGEAWKSDWITVVPAGTPDKKYAEYHYTDGKKSGTMTFRGLSPGRYEARFYCCWNETSKYEVQARYAFSVKK